MLDDVLQLTELDEFAYHEMLVHVPVFSFLKSTKKSKFNCLLIGAGDGGAARELLKHPRLTSVMHIEIDELVVKTCKEWLPNVSNGAFESDRHELHVADGVEFLRMTGKTFDVILVDSGDPTQGPNSSLFKDDFYALLKKCLDPEDGVLCFQAETVWFHNDLVNALIKRNKELFPVVEYFYTQVPTYPGGQIGFIVCAPNAKANVKEPPTEEEYERIGGDFVNSLNYYSGDMHRASFVLPKRFVQ